MTKFRTTPDPAVRKPPAAWLRTLWLLGIILSLLPLLPIWTATYYASRPPGFASLGGYLQARVMRHVVLLNPFLPAPDKPGAEDKVPAPRGPHAKFREGVSCELVRAPPIPEEKCTGSAECPPAIKPRTVPVFVLSPEGAARDKAVMYLYGGGVSRCRPQR